MPTAARVKKGDGGEARKSARSTMQNKLECTTLCAHGYPLHWSKIDNQRLLPADAQPRGPRFRRGYVSWRPNDGKTPHV